MISISFPFFRKKNILPPSSTDPFEVCIDQINDFWHKALTTDPYEFSHQARLDRLSQKARHEAEEKQLREELEAQYNVSLSDVR